MTTRCLKLNRSQKKDTNSNNKKVAIIVSKLRIGGAEQFVITLAKALKKLGHDPHIIIFFNEIELPIPSEIPIHIFDYEKYRKYPRIFRQYVIPNAIDNFIIDKIGATDLVLSNLYSVDKFMARSTLPNVYLIVHNTLSKREKLSNKYLRRLKNTYLAKPCIGVSEGVSKDLQQLLGKNLSIKTIYDPVDIEKSINLAEAFIPPFENFLVNVSSFKPVKRQDKLLHAYAKSELKIPLVLVGDGEKRGETEALAHKLNINHKVHFIGNTTNPYPYIKNATAMVISSDVEGLNISMLEAIVLGIPVISTNCPSGPSEVLPERNLCPVEDIKALAQQMQKVVVDPESYIISLAEHFYPDYAAQQYLSLIKD